MNKTLKTIALVVVVASILLSACSPKTTPAPATAAPATATATLQLPTDVPTQAFTPTLEPTPLPAATLAANTATPDSFQFLERPVTVTVVVDGEIDWNEQLVIDGWLETDCLATGIKCFYNQSAVGKTQTIKNVEVKQGAELVFGAFSASVEVKDLTTGKTVSLSRTKGVYGTIPAGLLITNLTITDGFMVMVATGSARDEFCARVAQTYAEKWALSTTFPNPDWSEPICSGTYKVPVDSDRLNGGSLPFVPTATP